MATEKRTPKRYPPELKTEPGIPKDFSAITRVTRQLGIGTASLRTWVKEAEIDSGSRAGLTTEERAEQARLRKENRELR
jgi:transposase